MAAQSSTSQENAEPFLALRHENRKRKQTNEELPLASLIYFLPARANKEWQLGKISGAVLRDA